jgi:hypothetical protein
MEPVLVVEMPAMALPDGLADLAVTAVGEAGGDYAEGRHYLVRPDGYVALSAAAEAEAEAEVGDLLRRVQGR